MGWGSVQKAELAKIETRDRMISAMTWYWIRCCQAEDWDRFFPPSRDPNFGQTPSTFMTASATDWLRLSVCALGINCQGMERSPPESKEVGDLAGIALEDLVWTLANFCTHSE